MKLFNKHLGAVQYVLSFIPTGNLKNVYFCFDTLVNLMSAIKTDRCQKCLQMSFLFFFLEYKKFR